MRFPGGGMTVLSVFLLVPLGIFLVSGAARAEEESSPLSRADAWLAGLEEQADVLRTRPELRMLTAEQERLMAFAALLEPPSVREEIKISGTTVTAPLFSASALESGLYRLMRSEEAVDRMESLIHGLKLLVSKEAGPGAEPSSIVLTEEQSAALKAYLDCALLLARPEFFGEIWESPLSGGEQPVLKEGTESRRDELTAMLDTALAHELPQEAVWPLRVMRAGLLLAQARPQAALQDLDGIGVGPVATGGEKRLRAHGLYLRSLALMRSGNTELAARDLDRALSLTPGRPELLLARGTLLRMRGRLDAMCDDFYAACAEGLCEGLEIAREQGYCGGKNTTLPARGEAAPGASTEPES